MSGVAVRICQLTSADIDLLRQLNALFEEAFSDDEFDDSKSTRDADCPQTLAREHVIALVATLGAAVVGGLVAYELHKLERHRSVIYLYDLAVAARSRRQGVATLLIAELQTIAKERGADEVYVQADYGDDAAIALYGKLGVRKAVLHFDLPR